MINKETVKNFFAENPHELQNEIYGDGISSYGLYRLRATDTDREIISQVALEIINRR